MKRNRQASLSKTTSANDTGNQTEASGSSTNSGSSTSVGDTSFVGAEDIQRLTSKNNSPSKGFGLVGQLYNPDSAYQEQLLLTEQGENRQEQHREATPTKLKTAPNRYSLPRLSALFNRGSGMVGTGSSGGCDSVDGGEELLKQESVKASTKKVMKMSRNGDKNKDNTNGGHPHNGNGDVGGGDDVESNSKSEANPKICTKSRCLLALLMVTVLIIATVLILIFSVPSSDDTKCIPHNLPFPQLNNKLFATKTLYTTTLNFLTKEPLFSTDGNPLSLSYRAPPTPSPRVNDTPPITLQLPTNFNYAPTSITKPEIFTTEQSLKTVHVQLTKMGCVLRQFHFFGRHAARLPNEDGIKKMNKTIHNIKKRLETPDLLITSASDDAIDAAKQTFSPKSSVPPSSPHRIDSSNKSYSQCSDLMAELRQWNFFAKPEQGNLLTEAGTHEASSMAKRFKTIFPELFDGNKANISFGTTSAIRTAQTAVNFLKEMDNYMPPGVTCTKDQFPVMGISDKFQVDNISGNNCLKQLIEKSNTPMLSFHEQCESLAGGNITPLDYKLKLKDPQRTKSIVQSVSGKLKWAKKNDKLTDDEVKAMYDVCRYESAIKRTTSIWCNYFTDKDLKFYEYLADVQDYFESAYGHDDQAKSACPITASVFSSVSSHLNRMIRPGIPPDYKPEAHFYFTHSEVLQRLIAAFVDLKNDTEYKLENILHHLEHGTVPKNRQWQTSLFTPFSGNLAFNLYNCPLQPPASQGTIAFDVNQGSSPLKIVASLNEQPIMLTGCESYICDYNNLMFKSRFYKQVPDPASDTCDLKHFCKTKYVLT